MARLNDTSSKKRNKLKRAISIALLLSLCCGCTVSDLDAVRPEVNHVNGLLTDGSPIIEDLNSLAAHDGTSAVGGSNVDDTSGGALTPDNVEVQSKTLPLAYDIVASSSYSSYMAEVYDNLTTAMRNAGVDMTKAYVRVFHYGYNPSATDSGKMEIASTFNSQSVGSVSYVTGCAPADYALHWLGPVNDNANRVMKKKNSLMTWLWSWNNMGHSSREDSGASFKDSYGDYATIWNSILYRDLSTMDYRQAVSTNSARTLYNLQLAFKNARGVTSYVKCNVPKDGETLYWHRMDKGEVDDLFTAVNQSSTCSRAESSFYSDLNINGKTDECLIFGHITGHTRTVVMVGAELFPGETLQDFLGTSYDSVFGITKNVIKCTDVNGFKTKVNPDAVTISAGTTEVSAWIF